MLHENPLMLDIDVDHWRNMQSLLLDSAKARRRIIVIHEKGEIQKFVHSHRLPTKQTINRIENAGKAAAEIYDANQGVTDYVMILERKAVEDFFAKVQDSWDAKEDLDVYVHRMFVTLDDFPEGILTYPEKARSTLGLQWRLGASYEEVIKAVQAFVEPGTTILLGIFSEGMLWGSLVLGFDSAKKIASITTADPSELSLSSDWKVATKELVNWAGRKFTKCSLGLFTDVSSARGFLSSPDKASTLNKLMGSGELIVDPIPPALKLMLNA